jgi:hypothetical protein
LSFSSLSRETIKHFEDFLQKKILYFSGFLGDIETIEVNSNNQLRKELLKPHILGLPSFSTDRLIKDLNFSKSQRVELDYLHLFEIQKIKLDKILTNPQLSIFNDIREMIRISNLEKEKEDDFIERLLNKIEDNDVPF